MAILYFLGGHDPFLEGGVHITYRALREAGGDPSVLILPWGLERREAERRMAELRSAFRDLGATAEPAWPEESKEAFAAKLRASDMVFLADGDPRTILRALRSSQMGQLLQGYHGVVVGDAAGANVMTMMALLPPDRYSSTYNMVPGLNLVDFCVVPRYTRDKDQYVIEASSGRTVFGIPEGSAVMYGAGLLSHSGIVHMFKNGKRTILEDGALL
ncbi:MAG TPA: Type 1 glutamine amidotransferase-like domain-containing protein [Methanomassiliicoccaceae archaeon]|jgi:peptidase E|nr:type 1 glutamine amidotransferase-like domain-containing protein [Euryarchaeota archaeon]HOB38365.1 Type 1 glutamine amidotransferase-like domain-containing protein [Methanomassiliicoccaceae archaeon]HOL07107.1 Type 1 glutamine amidotransferase-like domain-containing protein [Methanomassiliicoccaceae archaeon]HOQ25254.1 Type 1 glutamine amidotransferase-like domain-containing protein [Methanomassiliicoccaceae archaeon]HPP45423.1 Type 1 glutamine amidotransferase-like domain-containing protei